jgi:4-hydroxy-3-methylbut-2-enyl diphosphate reductase
MADKENIPRLTVEVDEASGFCFGVVRAIAKAEEHIRQMPTDHPELVSLGDIVHNDGEVGRLAELGLHTVPETTDMATLAGRTVLIRAHGEPPSTYDKALVAGVTLIDATCPVVAKLQKTVATAAGQMRESGGQVIIYGKRGHAEVRGLTGQTTESVIVVEGEGDLNLIDFTRPIYFLAQTTSSLSEFGRLGEIICERAIDPSQVTIHDTVCRQVSGREEHLAEFARRFDVVVFVAGAKSSNGRVLFEAVHTANPNSHKIENPSELRPEWFEGVRSAGVCGATSTPRWLMEQVAGVIEIMNYELLCRACCPTVISSEYKNSPPSQKEEYPSVSKGEVVGLFNS